MNKIENMQITVLVEDTKNPTKPGLIAKHGLSFFIELKSAGHTTKLLLDTGPSEKIILQNAQKLGVDFREVNLIVLSHGHYDHTGGVLAVLNKVGKITPVITHPEALQPKFVVKKTRLKKIGVPFLVSDMEKLCCLILKRGPTSLVPGVWVSGKIKRISKFEKVTGFKTELKGRLVNDFMLDDQALVVDIRGKGLVVICGCAHAGVINTIKQAKRLSGSSDVYAVIGGFHLIKSSAKRIKETIRELQREDLSLLIPGHCTGKKAISKFMAVFGEKCKQLRVGDKIVF